MLPGEPARWRRPATKKLPNREDLSGVVAVVRRNGLQHFERTFLASCRGETGGARPTFQLMQPGLETLHNTLPLRRIRGTSRSGPTARGMAGERRPPAA